MFSLRIENLHSLKDTDFISIKPLTILLGENNSGKSSFLRSFPLFRQSISRIARGPILWFGQYVDFGSFKDALRVNSEKREIVFSLKFTITEKNISTYYFRAKDNYKLSKKINFEFRSVVANTRLDEDYIKELEVKFFNHKIHALFSGKGEINKLLINGQNFTDYCSQLIIHSESIIPYLSAKGEGKKISRLFRTSLDSIFLKNLFEEVQGHLTKNTGKETVLSITKNLLLGFSNEILESIKNNNAGTITWKKNTSDWTINSAEFIRLKNIFIADNISWLLDICNEYFRTIFASVKYVAPIRASAERYYRIQNLSIQEVDYQGQNLAMFLRGLSKSEKQDFSDWVNGIFGFTPKVEASPGHISLRILESYSDKDFNVADMGFGYSQLLPVITQLWDVTRKKPLYRYLEIKPVIFAMEQPELHLHPRLQALLAKSFVNSLNLAKKNDIDLNLIIETHSQTVVNKIGELISREIISNQDVNIVIFEKSENKIYSSIRFSTFDKDGYLKNWPYGFFEPSKV